MNDTAQKARAVTGAEMRADIRSLREDVITSTQRLSPDDTRARTSSARNLWIGETTEAPGEGLVHDVTAHSRDFLRRASELHETSRATVQVQLVLNSLYFPEIRARQKQIPQAHAETCRWIFERDSPDRPGPLKFVNWLDSQTGIFWIQGKPGSGKSTLMKFISEHVDTQNHLRLWASGRTLVPGNFFWHAGSPLQKSREGLLRSILFEILRRCPDLVPRVYELRSGPEGNFEDDDWSWTADDLLQVCCDVLQSAKGHRFCFFIDGLDEYEEGRMTSRDLINIVESLGRSSNVKLCVSSRPWSAFADAFGQSPDLRSGLKI